MQVLPWNLCGASQQTGVCPDREKGPSLRYAVLPVSSELCPLRPASTLWGEIAQGPPSSLFPRQDLSLSLAGLELSDPSVQIEDVGHSDCSRLGVGAFPFLSLFFFSGKLVDFPKEQLASYWKK